MTRIWPTVFALLVVAIAVAVGVWAYPRGDPAPPPPPELLPVARPGGEPMVCGMSLQLHSGDPAHPYERCIDQIAGIGANTLCLVVAAYQENASSTSLFLDHRKMPSDQRLAELIDHAHAAGLDVVLMPIILLENPRPTEWRGKIKPTDWDAWWEDYKDFIVHYARLAQRSDVEVLMIGSELLSTERDETNWRALIGLARYEFDGLLSYSTNWDHYQVPTFWDGLDLIGMTTYFDLTGGDEPTLDRLIEAWKPIRRDILTWQMKVGKPIVFTEVGWPNQTSCAEAPWDYTRNTDHPAPQWQANCFEAFFRTWGDQPSISGALIWEWKHHPDEEVDETDTSFVPCGKPALGVIERYFRLLGQRTDGAPTPAGASAADSGR